MTRPPRHLALLLLGLAMLRPGLLPAQRLQSFIGIELGYSASDLTGSGASGIEIRNGALTGAYFSTPLAGWLLFQPELLFTSRGGRTTVRLLDTGEIADYNLDLTYIEAPVLLRAFLPFPTRRVRTSLFAGSFPALRIGCTVQLTSATRAERRPCVAAEGVDIQRFDVGFVFGGGISLHTGRNPAALEARFSRGLRKVLANTAPLLNRSYSVLLSVPF